MGIKWTICILRLKTKKARKDKKIPASHTNLMKSCFAGWNPSELGWNLRCPTSDEIKSASFQPCEARFHRVAISSTKGGFIPTKADLVKKDCNFASKLQSFFVSNPKFWYSFIVGANFRVMGAFSYKGLHLF